MEAQFEEDLKDFDLEFEKLKAEVAGFEYECEDESRDDGDESYDEKPFNADKIRIDQQMLSLKYLVELMKDDFIELNPGYQRNRVWKENKRKSLLIESLMLRIPIPAFYFFENEDGKFQVIDGQQRLTTIKEFVNNEFKLSGLEYLGEEYNKKYFRDLDIKYKQRIYRTQLAVNILDARSPKRVVYDIFRRVNTGGIGLNPQEMRNAICKQEVRDLLKLGTKNENYLKATRGKIKDVRMDSQEMVLRFFAFYSAYNFEKKELNYNFPGILEMLDDAIEKLNTMSFSEHELLYSIFDESMRRCYDAFGEYCFSKIQLNDDKRISRKLNYINKSMYAAFSVLLMDSKYDGIDIKSHQNELLTTLAEALQSHSYANSITVGTGDRGNLETNFAFSKEVLERCLSID